LLRFQKVSIDCGCKVTKKSKNTSKKKHFFLSNQKINFLSGQVIFIRLQNLGQTDVVDSNLIRWGRKNNLKSHFFCKNLRKINKKVLVIR